LSGSANIGFRTALDIAASPNVIQNNGNIGINVTESSSARIDGNTITGNSNAGINVGENASARIGFSSGLPGGFAAANTIQNNMNNGIRVYGSGYAAIEGNMIAYNTNAGISIDTGSSAEIGVKGFINRIQNNTGGGIVVSRSSSARIQAAVISNNTGHGVQIRRASQADIDSNTINANTMDGIRLEENSALNIFPSSNTTSTNNGQFGIRCLTGSYAVGSIGTLVGNNGQKSFGTTYFLIENPAVSINSEGCIDRTSP
jgi:parallel beta-helix repeat protein